LDAGRRCYRRRPRELRDLFDVGVKADVGVLKVDVGVLKVDVGVLKADVGVLKADVGALKADVGVLKADVSVLKADVGGLKADVGRLNVGFAELQDSQVSLHVQLARLDQKVHVLHEANLDQFKLLAEGQVSIRQEIARGFSELREEMGRRLDPLELAVRYHSKLLGSPPTENR
jgi:chromosome segregation ATPase